jgi:hypothetical protein
VNWILAKDQRQGAGLGQAGTGAPLACLDERDAEGRTPLHYAGRWGDVTVLRALVEAGADPWEGDVHGHTALDEAEYWGHDQAVSQTGRPLSCCLLIMPDD